MKLAIIGSRSFDDYNLLKQICDKIHTKYVITEIVSGGAKGADLLGERFANEYAIKTNIFIPDWNRHGKSAGFIRNNDIVNHSDLVLAFWDGVSKGTNHSINIAKKTNKPIIIFNYKSKTYTKYGY